MLIRLKKVEESKKFPLPQSSRTEKLFAKPEFHFEAKYEGEIAILLFKEREHGASFAA